MEKRYDGGKKNDASAMTHGDKWVMPAALRKEMSFAITSGLFLLTGFVLSLLPHLHDYLSITFYIGAYLFGGYFTTIHAISDIRKGHFEIDFLMLVAALGAIVLENWAEGALLLFLFSMGHALEHYAMAKAKKSIEALAKLTPGTALLKKDHVLQEVAVELLQKGDTIVVKPHTKIAADGVVIQGNSSVNEASITGESIPADKSAFNATTGIVNEHKIDKTHRVFAGTINGNGQLDIYVTRVAADSTIAQLIKLVNEAQEQKSPTQHFAEKIEKYYVPAVLILVTVLLFAFLVVDEPFSDSFYRAMAVLVGASPCALAISTPSAVLSGIARAARGGVLIKGGKPLEDLGALTAIAFDKTGTLTEGNPKLTGVYPQEKYSEEQLLEIVVAVEQLSDHPLAAAIVKGGKERLGKEVAPPSNLVATPGRGVQAQLNGAVVFAGNKALFTDNGVVIPDDILLKMSALERRGNTTMLVRENDEFIGIITVMDVARKDAKITLAALLKAGIRKMIMLTGDNQKVADAIAVEIGITDAWGDLLPGEKVAAIERLKKTEHKIAMVGDGVNDAPAMARSTVGIAMGAAGSDVALETADIALMADKLSSLPFAIGLSRKARAIIRQNVLISLGMVAVLIPLTLLGVAKMGPAVIGHEGSTIVVVFNALRLLLYKQKPLPV